MKISSYASIMCETCANNNFEWSNTARRRRRRRKMFSPIALCLVYVAVTFITPVNASISGSSGRRISFDIIARDLGYAEENFPGLERDVAGNHESSRRRSRRSSKELDMMEFRKFMHQARKTMRGGRANFPSGASRRNNFITFSERSSTSSAIAKNVRCGGCRLARQWIPVSKPGCRSNFILVPTCMGMCETWQIPDVNPPYVTTHHRVCRPTQLEFRKITLRRCQPGVNPSYVVPIAKNCACTKCRNVNTACRPW